MALLFTFVGALAAAGGAAAGPTALEILESSCLRCHGADQPKGGLDLTTRQALLRGGDSGPAVIPGDAAASLLLRLVTHADEPVMPRKADKLPEEAVARLRAWIDAGAPYDRVLVARDKPEAHWAFRPLRPGPSGDSIDGLVRRTLSARRLAPSPPADRRTLVRRAYLDLIGLPPSPREVEAFVRDPAPDAWPRLVDRLLGSPHYGERWGRHWLDVARYADSAGYESDADRPHAHAYRDFVIRALNADMPFDRFARWQLAGDELAPDDPEARAATGFLAVAAAVAPNPTDTKANKEMYRYDELDDMLATTGAAFLGLTVGCARCHDHKYDPISTRDYHSLLAAFVSTRRQDVSLHPAVRAWEAFLERERRQGRERRMATLGIPEEDRDLLRVPLSANNPTQRRVYERWDARLRFSDDELRAELAAADEWDQLSAAAARAAGPLIERRALTLTDDGPDALPAFLLARGDARSKIAPIDFQLPAFLGGVRDPAFWRKRLPPELPARTTMRRAALSLWLTDVDNGAGRLLARVTANRIWQHHFGQGLVATPNDLGTQAEAPVHGPLLDHLAAALIAGGWRLKPLHRAIMTSAIYTQRAGADERRRAADPDGRLLSHRRLLRLEAEVVRDALLASSGALEPQMFGPGIKPAIPEEAMGTRATGYPTDTPDGPAIWRRSIYLYTKRSARLPLMEVLDAPDASASCGRRSQTTVPTQSLALLNDGFVRARARDFAVRLLVEAGPAPAAQVTRAFQIALGRPPGPAEREAAVRFLAERSKARAGRTPTATALARARFGALSDLCHALYVTNEFAYVH